MSIEGYYTISKLDSGASSVEKYKLCKNGKNYLLRVFDARFMESRYKALANMEFLYENDIGVPKIYSKGLLNNEKGYALLDWIDGVSLEQIMTNQELEIRYGEYAAKDLLKMHSIEVKKQVEVYDVFMESFSKKMKKVMTLEIEKKYLKLIEDFVRNNCNILKHLDSNCVIHGDFHPGNIIIDNDRLVFIDMDMCKVSHSWEDLSSNACNMEFPNFYSSVIVNYFNGEVPEMFWQVYNLYGCLYVIDYILYTLRIKGKTLEDGQEKLKEFLEFSDYFQNFVPSWFNKEIKVKQNINGRIKNIIESENIDNLTEWC